MHVMTLSKGHAVVVDDEDADLARWRWKSLRAGRNRTTCAVRSVRLPGKRYGTIYMHRVIAARMGLEIEGLSIDHIDGDSLNNRRENLRAVTQAVNSKNTATSVRNTSGHRGVSWINRDSCWRAQMATNGKMQNLGSFQTKEEAIACRLAAESKQWGIQPRRRQFHEGQS